MRQHIAATRRVGASILPPPVGWYTLRMGSEKTFTHLNEKGEARMVDVSDKTATSRRAVASGRISISAEAMEALSSDTNPKGDVLAAARIAGVLAAKKTADLIPLCHPLGLDFCEVTFCLSGDFIDIRSEVKVNGPTGVEMEAITAVSIAAVTIYDMCKSFDKRMVISDIMLLEKEGGKSGHFKRVR